MFTKSNENKQFNDPVSTLLYKLVQHQIPPPFDPEKQEQYNQRVMKVFKYLLRIMSSRITPTFSQLQDDLAISEQIKKQLMKENRIQDAVKFSDLYRRIKNNKLLKNKWAIMYLLYSLSNTESPQMNENIFLSYMDKYSSFDEIKKKKEEIPTKAETPKFTPMKRKFDESIDDYHNYINTSFEVSEEVLVREILFVFQGIEGNYIKFDKFRDAFMVDPKIGVPSATRDMVNKLCELGWLFKKVKTFIDESSKHSSSGLVMQSFVAAVNTELQSFYHLISELQTQIQSIGSKEAYQQLSLRRLVVWTIEPLERMKMLAVLTDVCKNHRGGALCSVLYGYIKHGDSMIRSMIERLCKQVFNPLLDMIRRWVIEGELEDPYKEFFVCADPSKSLRDLWHKKYSIRKEMLPIFISLELAQKILNVGKSINFIRQCCKDAEWMMDPNTMTMAKEGFNDFSQIGQLVDRAANITNKKVMELMFDTFKFSKHCTAIRQYLLLAQGDFIQYLLDLLKNDLNKPAKTIYRHNLLGVLESAIRGSNLQYVDPDINERLDVRMLETNEQTLGWDVFTLYYNISTPLDTIFTKEVMTRYLRLFRWLWRIKRVETALNTSWKKQMTTSHTFSKYKNLVSAEISQLLHASSVIRHEMVHFLSNLQYYLMFEVMDTSWQDLVKKTNQIFKNNGDLDQLIAAHEKYLTRVETQSLVGKSELDLELRKHLEKMLIIIMQFISIQGVIHTTAMNEINSLKVSSTLDTLNRSSVEPKYFRNSLTSLNNIREEYSKLFRQLLKILSQRKSEENLQYLKFRLDFNYSISL